MIRTTLVKQLMSPKVITVEPAESVGAALHLMLSRHVRHLCVVEAGQLHGVITDRDIHRALPSPLVGASARDYHHALEVPVAKVMTRDPYWVTPDTEAVDAVRRMIDHRIGCLPVMADGTLAGIVTRADWIYLLEGLLTPSAKLLSLGTRS